MTENEIGSVVVDTAIHLHRDLGPGLLESVYEIIMARLLEKKCLRVQRQVGIPVVYAGERFDEGFRADMIIESKVILEIKSVEKLHPVHSKQLLTYLKLTGMRLGYVLNFGEEVMKTGINRIVNGYF